MGTRGLRIERAQKLLKRPPIAGKAKDCDRTVQRAAILCVAARLASEMRAEAVILGAYFVYSFQDGLGGARFPDGQRDPGRRHVLDDGDGLPGAGHPGRMVLSAVAVDEIDHQPQHDGGFVIDVENPLAAPLHLSGDRLVRRKNQPVAVGHYLYAIIGDEPAEPAAPPGLADEVLREPTLSGGGAAAQQNAGAADDDRHAVDGPGAHGAAGSQTVKRAPSGFSGSFGSVRFIARIRPLCASTIWREIDRPRPEFWPNPWLGRSV